jgi:hypothetical protein
MQRNQNLLFHIRKVRSSVKGNRKGRDGQEGK